jgi:hypothetical protein
MCLIIDPNVVHKLFSKPTADYAPVIEAIENQKARVVYGGYITVEYRRMGFSKVLLRLDQQGSTRPVPDDRVNAETSRLIESGVCRSDDPHIVALAIVGKVRLLCSEDNLLATDFTNTQILAKPPGNVYKRAAHSHLISKHCGSR